MNRRLQQFLSAENISQSQFADTIGVARASVSHILAGRNKPGFDFIENMSKNYPSLNLEWLITGKGKMYKTAQESHSKAVAGDLFADFEESPAADFQAPSEPSPVPAATIYKEVSEPSKGPKTAQTPLPAAKITRNTDSDTLYKEIKQVVNQRSIVKIVVFYDDNTYQELK